MDTRRPLTYPAVCRYWHGCNGTATGEMLDPIHRHEDVWVAVCRKHGGYPTPPIVCAGQVMDHDRGVLVGEPCGRRFKGVGEWGPTAEQQAEQARAAGWSVTGPPMCPSCRRPDPAIARGLALLETPALF